jgi:hypothetical protein
MGKSRRQRSLVRKHHPSAQPRQDEALSVAPHAAYGFEQHLPVHWTLESAESVQWVSSWVSRVQSKSAA